MEILKKRSIAILITLIMIIAAVLFGSHRSLNSMRNAALDVFYNGVSGDGIGIAGDLNRRVNLASNLMVIASKYLTDDELASFNNQPYTNLLIDSMRTLKDTDRLNKELTAYTSVLISRLEDMELSEKDSEYLRNIDAELKSRNNTIMHDAYNALAQEFNQKLTAFPAGVLASLTSVKTLEVFR